jgi:hypothetical protein
MKTCAYCGRPITNGVVITLAKKAYHATENDRGETSERACWELSGYGALTLISGDP